MTTDPNTTEYGSAIPGLVRLQPGDVVNVFGVVAMVVKATEANSHVAEASRRQRTVTDRVTGETATFKLPPQRHIISTTLPKEDVIQRQGAAGLAYFLKTRTVQGVEQTKTSDTEHEGENSMAAKKKNTKKAAAPEAAEGKASTKGQLGNVMGYSTCSVLRRLGIAGVDNKQAKAILGACGVQASDATIATHISQGAAGKKGKSVAPLTKAQVDELKAKAPQE